MSHRLSLVTYAIDVRLSAESPSSYRRCWTFRPICFFLQSAVIAANFTCLLGGDIYFAISSSECLRRSDRQRSAINTFAREHRPTMTSDDDYSPYTLNVTIARGRPPDPRPYLPHSRSPLWLNRVTKTF